MTIQSHDTIDIVGLDEPTQTVLLVMVESRDWGGLGLLLPDLEAKLDTYLSFVTSGKLLEAYPQVAGRPVRIELHTLHEPGERELELLEIVQRLHLEPAGIEFRIRRLGAAVS